MAKLERRLRPSSFPDRSTWFTAFSAKLAACHPGADQQSVLQRYSGLIGRNLFFPTTVLLHHGALGEPSAGGCLVWPLPDDLGELYTNTIPALWTQLSVGNGVGLDLSVLTPRLQVNPSGRLGAGPIATLTALTSAFDGPLRYTGLKRAAFMASLAFDHPDIFEFVTHKRHHVLECANLSVAVDRRYLEGLDRSACVPLRWQTPSGDDVYLTRSDLVLAAEKAAIRGVPPPDLQCNADGGVHSHAASRLVGHVVSDLVMVELSLLHQQIALAAHDCGDPGLLDLDAINRHNPTHPRHTGLQGEKAAPPPGVGSLATTAPCGEQPLLPFESCFLGSFNLPKFISDGSFDFHSFREAIPHAVCMMDDLIDMAPQGLPQMHQALQASRKIGLGIMGLADVLAEIEVPYDSAAARGLAAEIVRTLHETAVHASRQLARTRGPFPSWPYSSYAVAGEDPRRNATVTTVAPTGHISRLAGCSPSLEPYFDFRSELNHAKGGGVLSRKLGALGFSLSEWLAISQARNGAFQWDGTLRQLVTDPTNDPHLNDRLHSLQAVFKTARELDADAHLAMLSSVAPHVENAVSKTVNLPEFTTVAEVAALFERALRLELKGITIYRDRCRGIGLDANSSVCRTHCETVKE